MIKDALSRIRQKLLFPSPGNAIVLRFITKATHVARPEVYEVYNTIHDASMKQLASHGGPHNGCDSIIGAIDFSQPSVIFRACCPALQ